MGSNASEGAADRISDTDDVGSAVDRQEGPSVGVHDDITLVGVDGLIVGVSSDPKLGPVVGKVVSVLVAGDSVGSSVACKDGPCVRARDGVVLGVADGSPA